MGISNSVQESAIETLASNGLVRLGDFKPYHIEITDTIGRSILRSPHELDNLDLNLLPQNIAQDIPNLFKKTLYHGRGFFMKMFSNIWFTSIIAGLIVLILGTLILVKFKIIK